MHTNDAYEDAIFISVPHALRHIGFLKKESQMMTFVVKGQSQIILRWYLLARGSRNNAPGTNVISFIVRKVGQMYPMFKTANVLRTQRMKQPMDHKDFNFLQDLRWKFGLTVPSKKTNRKSLA